MEGNHHRSPVRSFGKDRRSLLLGPQSCLKGNRGEKPAFLAEPKCWKSISVKVSSLTAPNTQWVIAHDEHQIISLLNIAKAEDILQWLFFHDVVYNDLSISYMGVATVFHSSHTISFQDKNQHSKKFLERDQDSRITAWRNVTRLMQHFDKWIWKKSQKSGWNR